MLWPYDPQQPRNHPQTTRALATSKEQTNFCLDNEGLLAAVGRPASVCTLGAVPPGFWGCPSGALLPYVWPYEGWGYDCRRTTQDPLITGAIIACSRNGLNTAVMRIGTTLNQYCLICAIVSGAASRGDAADHRLPGKQTRPGHSWRMSRYLHSRNTNNSPRRGLRHVMLSSVSVTHSGGGSPTTASAGGRRRVLLGSILPCKQSSSFQTSDVLKRPRLRKAKACTPRNNVELARAIS